MVTSAIFSYYSNMTHSQAVDILKEHDIRPTLQRIEVAKAVLNKNWHLTAAALSEEVNKLYPKVARASIFNTIKLFEKQGLLKRIELSAEETYYDSNRKPHHHLIDKKKKKIYDIDLPASLENKIKEMLQKELQKKNISAPADVDINITALVR